MDAQGWLWEPVGALEGLVGRYCTTLETVRATFWHNFGVLEATFGQQFKKICKFMISTPICRGIGGLGGWGHQVGAVWAPRWLPRGGLDGQNGHGQGQQRGQDSKKAVKFGRPVRCSVGVMELARICLNPAQTQVEAEVKVYLSDKSYD